MRWMLAAALLMTGCSGDDEVLPPDARAVPDAPEQPDGATFDADTTDAAPLPDAIPCVVFGGGVREDMAGMPFPALPPLADVSVKALIDGAQVDQDMSAADGSWSVCIPPNSSVALVLEKTGFNNQAFLQVVQTTPRFMDVRLYHEAALGPFWSGVPATYPSTTSGFVTVIAFDSALTTTVAGVSMSLVPASGTGVFYWDPMFVYDSALTATSTLGLAAFANVQPGQVDLVLDHATLTCGHEQGGFVSPTPGALRIPVVAGVETSINLKCE